MPGNAHQASHGDYQLLGLPYGASPDEVRKAYKAFVKAWHPDRFPQGSRRQRQADDRLKDVNAAYRRIRGDWEIDRAVRGRQPASPVPPSAARRREPAANEAATPPPAFSFSRTQAWRQILSVSHPFKVSRGWLMLILLLPLLALLIELEPSPPPVDHRPVHQNRKPDSFPPAGPVAAPPELSQTTVPSDLPRAIPQASPKAPDPRPPAGGPELHHHEDNFFSLGSTKAQVQRIQGKPAKVLGQTWVYGLSDVTFREGRVWRYHNFDGTLRVQILPSTPPTKDLPPGSFTLGASRDEVLRVQGTPTHVEGNKWSYGFSDVFFKDGIVVGFNNFFHNLKVAMQPSPGFQSAAVKDYFSIGSSQDEVLALQGTPTMVQGNLWSYELSDILFVDGKVRSVNDFSGNLQFSQPDAVAGK